jgi:hypothetical protein
MPARPSDEELAAYLAEEYELQERTRRQSARMNALLRGQPPPDETNGDEPAEEFEHGTTGDPADMSAAIRRATGRTYKSRKQEEQN